MQKVPVALSVIAVVSLSGRGLAYEKMETRSDLSGFYAAEDYPRIVSFSESDPLPKEFEGGFNDMLPYILPSPNQLDAGSCLYMANTGIAEWWLSNLHPGTSRTPNGDIDLSERYLMGVAGYEEDKSAVPNWRTDTIFLFNGSGYSLKNSVYPFTMGWYVRDDDGTFKVAKEGESGALYDTSFNWINLIPEGGEGRVELPKFEREVIFADPEKNQWNVGITPLNIVETVKEALRVRKAPVLVIYNHNAYWHAVFLVGYNDFAENGNCQYTERFRVLIVERAGELQKSADEAKTTYEREYYSIRAERAFQASRKIEKAYAERGGCHGSKGVFYIRDSIYPDPKGQIYDYDPKRTGEEEPYTKKVVIKEYDWLEYFANHISQVKVVR
ncbi:MAG: hypothetical protein HQK54_12110 [Oligoflexales bacterium]|nr:hypothetical protein [Oligoflexales bacterium]